MQNKKLTPKNISKLFIVVIFLLLVELSRVTKFNNKQGIQYRKSKLKIVGFMILLIVVLSIFVFPRTSYWTTRLVNLSIDSDFGLFVDVTNFTQIKKWKT